MHPCEWIELVVDDRFESRQYMYHIVSYIIYQNWFYVRWCEMALDAQYRWIRCGGGHINRRSDEIHLILRLLALFSWFNWFYPLQLVWGCITTLGWWRMGCNFNHPCPSLILVGHDTIGVWGIKQWQCNTSPHDVCGRALLYKTEKTCISASRTLITIG